MDSILPFGVLSPSTVKRRPFQRIKDSKLSLKKKLHRSKENCNTNSNLKHTSRIPVKSTSSCYTSDESDSDGEGNFHIRRESKSNFSISTTFSGKSSFCVPIAESTKLEPKFEGAPPPSQESSGTQYYTAVENFSPEEEMALFTAVTAQCEQSVIYLSDSSISSELSLPNIVDEKQWAVVSSTDNDEDDESNGSISVKYCPDAKTKTRFGFSTIVIDDSDDEENVKTDCNEERIMDNKHGFLTKSDKIARSSSGSSLSLIGPSVTEDSVNESLNGSKDCNELRKDLSLFKYKQYISQGPLKSKEILDSQVQSSNERHQSDSVDDSAESSWKKDFKLLMPESTQSTKDSSELSFSLTRHCPSTLDNYYKEQDSIIPLSTSKYENIQSWLGNMEEEIKVDEPKKKENFQRYQSSDSEDSDKFEAFLSSVKRKPPSSVLKKTPPNSSPFFVDDTEEHNPHSPTLYHKDLTKTIERELKTVRRQAVVAARKSKKQLDFSNDSEDSDSSDSESSSDRWTPALDPSKNKKKLNTVNDKDRFKTQDKKGSKKDSYREPVFGGIKQAVVGDRKSKKQFDFPNDSENSDSSDSESSSDRWTPALDPSKNKKKLNTVNDKDRFKTQDKKGSKKDSYREPVFGGIKSVKQHQAVLGANPTEATSSPVRTFLATLSGPSSRLSIKDHPDAQLYWKSFKTKKEELAKRLFKLYNREVFDYKLPSDMPLEWSTRLIKTAGSCYCKLSRTPTLSKRSARIVLSTKVIDSADRLRDTLIHEMCHAAVWILDNTSGGHGPLWKAWAAKARKRFPELPPINVCHDYVIETKYTYRCTQCGYSFGRHSKSLNLQTKRCGRCMGTFEVFCSKSGKSSSAPPADRQPTGFALYVKENYKNVKKQNSDLKHGDIMKTLGKMFSNVKLTN